MIDCTDDNGEPVVQPHGGALRPWQPGQSGNREGMNHARRECHRLARTAAPDAMRTLIALMQDPAEDSRVRVVAANAILDRALGKAPAEPPKDTDGQRLDLSHLTDQERAEIVAALATIRRLTEPGAIEPGEGRR